MTRPARINLIITLTAVLLVAAVTAVIIVIQRAPSSTTTAPTSADVIAGARVLDHTPNAKVTVTEFLDFECESCKAMHPVVEQLRERYEGRVAFTFRYFPLPGHRNSTPAALAVEAAARQNKLEPMYRHLFETQPQWGESRQSQAGYFRQAAKRLGLDLARYDADLVDPDVQARVRGDFELGQQLGVSGTPTFFINGQPIELQQISDVETAILRALDS